MQNKPEPMPDLTEIMRLASSPAGQQLIRLLQQRGGSSLQDAVNKASSGDLSQAKEAVSALLKDPEAKKLLEQLGGAHE